MKKIITILMLVIMCFGFVFAQGQEEKVAVEKNLDPASTDPFLGYENPVEISFAKMLRPNAHFPKGQSVEDNTLIRMLNEKLNVDIKIDWQTVREDYNNKLSLNIASGDLADAFMITDYLTFRELVDNDMLADLSEAFDNCASDYFRETLATYNGKSLDTLTVDGKLYALPSANIGYEHNILFLRKDWLDKLGLEVPKTLDELKFVLKEFVEKDPGNNGEGNTIGLAIHATDPLMGYKNKYGVEPILHSVGAYPRQWMLDDNGKVYYGSTTPEMKEGLEILHEMYEEGLIDKQFITRIGTGETDAIVNSGLAGAFYAPWWGFNNELYRLNNDAELIAVNAPLDENGKYNHLVAAPVGDMFAVSKDFENPEALVKIISQEYEWYRGFDQAGYQRLYDDLLSTGSDREAIFPTSSFNLEYNDVVPKLGKLVKEYVDTGVLNKLPTTTSYDIAQAESAKRFAEGKSEPGTTAESDFKAYYRRYIASNILDAPENNPVSSAYYYTTDSSPLLKPTLDKLEQQMVLKIITGEEPIEYFDEFVEQWKKLGGDTLISEVQALM